MQTYTPEQVTEIKIQIAEALGLSRTPVNLTPNQTGEVLDTSTNTLSVWRNTGRYNLPYTKISRRVAYPINGVAEFLLSRTINHTGEKL
jgi:hypothetical protein